MHTRARGVKCGTTDDKTERKKIITMLCRKRDALTEKNARSFDENFSYFFSYFSLTQSHCWWLFCLWLKLVLFLFRLWYSLEFSTFRKFIYLLFFPSVRFNLTQSLCFSQHANACKYYKNEWNTRYMVVRVCVYVIWLSLFVQ